MEKKYFIVLLLSIMFFPINVNAFNGKINLSCDDTVINSDSTFTCLITGDGFNKPVSSFHGEITLSDGVTLVSVTKDSSWEGSGEGGVIDLYTDVNKTGNVNFASFVVKVNKKNSNQVVGVKEITVSDADFIEHKLDAVSKEIKVLGNNSNVINEEDDSSGENIENSENNVDLDDETVNNNDDIEENNEVENDNNIEKNDNALVTDKKSGNIWIAIVLLILSIIFILVIIYLRKRGKNV